MEENAPDPTFRRRDTLLKRLRPYCWMEGVNILLIPAITTWVVTKVAKERLTIATVASMFATSFLLVVGTIAWKIVVDNLQGNRQTEKRWVPRLAKVRWLALLFIALAIGATMVEAYQGSRVWSVNYFFCIALSILAVLEYINYYHRQLQHFDHAADFKRLMNGKGFRKSHLAKAIESYKRSNS